MYTTATVLTAGGTFAWNTTFGGPPAVQEPTARSATANPVATAADTPNRSAH